MVGEVSRAGTHDAVSGGSSFNDARSGKSDAALAGDEKKRSRRRYTEIDRAEVGVLVLTFLDSSIQVLRILLARLEFHRSTS